MLTNILNTNIDDYSFDDKNIKVNANELKMLISTIQQYQDLIFDTLGDFSQKERMVIDKNISYTEYFFNKYIVETKIREEQQKYYRLMKQLNSKSFTKDATESEIEEMRRAMLEQYLDKKMKKEQLDKELDKKKFELNI